MRTRGLHVRGFVFVVTLLVMVVSQARGSDFELVPAPFSHGEYCRGLYGAAAASSWSCSPSEDARHGRLRTTDVFNIFVYVLFFPIAHPEVGDLSYLQQKYVPDRAGRLGVRPIFSESRVRPSGVYTLRVCTSVSVNGVSQSGCDGTASVNAGDRVVATISLYLETAYEWEGVCANIWRLCRNTPQQGSAVVTAIEFSVGP